MRSKAALASLAVVALALAGANPGKDDFVRWFERKAEAAAQRQDVLTGVSLLERTLEVKTSLRRDNYLLFSVFHVRVMRREHTFVGVLGGFLGLGDARRAVPGAS
jgi:hypothetical protein